MNEPLRTSYLRDLQQMGMMLTLNDFSSSKQLRVLHAMWRSGELAATLEAVKEAFDDGQG